MNQKKRTKWAIYVLCGLYNTFENWTRIILPFIEWIIQPTPTLFHLILLNSFGNFAIFVGSFFIAEFVSF